MPSGAWPSGGRNVWLVQGSTSKDRMCKLRKSQRQRTCPWTLTDMCLHQSDQLLLLLSASLTCFQFVGMIFTFVHTLRGWHVACINLDLQVACFQSFLHLQLPDFCSKEGIYVDSPHRLAWGIGLESSYGFVQLC